MKKKTLLGILLAVSVITCACSSTKEEVIEATDELATESASQVESTNAASNTLGLSDEVVKELWGDDLQSLEQAIADLEAGGISMDEAKFNEAVKTSNIKKGEFTISLEDSKLNRNSKVSSLLESGWVVDEDITFDTGKLGQTVSIKNEKYPDLKADVIVSDLNDKADIASCDILGFTINTVGMDVSEELPEFEVNGVKLGMSASDITKVLGVAMRSEKTNTIVNGNEVATTNLYYFSTDNAVMYSFSIVGELGLRNVSVLACR